MSERDQLEALIFQNIPDNVSNLITPNRVRLVFSFIKDNFTPNSISDTYLTITDAEDRYTPLSTSGDYLVVPLPDSNTYTSLVAYDSQTETYSHADLLDGGIF